MSTVFTCGVFDLFHFGHLDFLLRARAMGEHLIVGVNADEYVVAHKGRQPLYPLRERMHILNALECVDRVIPFWENDPCELVRRLKPDIVAKGSEYSRENAPEAAVVEQLGGRFVVLESLPIHSSEILAKLKAAPPAVPPIAVVMPERLPIIEVECRFRGEEIERIHCKPCQESLGSDEVPVFACAHPKRKHHPKCTMHNVAARDSDGLRPLGCVTCLLREEA